MELILGSSSEENFTLVLPEILSHPDPDGSRAMDAHVDFVNPVKISVSAGAWTGRPITTRLLSVEVIEFLRGLSRCLSTFRGTARLESWGAYVSMTVTGDGLGHFRIEGELRDAPEGNKMMFSIGTDQSRLQGLVERIDAYLGRQRYR